MKKRCFVVPAILMLLMMQSALANVTTTSQMTLVAGDSADIAYLIVYHGASPTICHINTNISPDGDGFYLNYTPLFLLYDGANTFIIHVDTSPLLMPLNYSLNVSFDIEEIEPQIITNTNTITVTKIKYVNTTVYLPTNKTNTSIVIPLPSPPNPSVLPPPIIINIQKIVTADKGLVIILCFIIAIFISSTISLLYLYRKKKTEIKDIKEGKKIL